MAWIKKLSTSQLQEIKKESEVHKVGPILTQEEMYLFNCGEFYHSFRKFGAHFVKHEGRWGTHFALWAPQAKKVSVVGDFNGWRGMNHPMEKWGDHGIWTCFIPGLEEGEIYKYELFTSSEERVLRADPYAFFSEVRPHTASVIYSLEGYSWGDQTWLNQRKTRNLKVSPLSIYEIHLGSWKRTEEGRFLNYAQLTPELIRYVKSMGYTHVELLPLMEHPYDGSWGYQGTGFYSCTSRYGTPHDLMFLIDQCHQAGIGVILDWVPGHFCKDAHGLGNFDGSPLYEKEVHEHWGTYKFDYSRSEVWSFLISNAVFWLEVFHVDGLRVDGVSSMLYLDYGKEGGSWQANLYGGRENLEAVGFLKRLNETVNCFYPEVLMIAEEATDWQGVTSPLDQEGLGFTFKWNMGWMNDTLRYINLDFHERRSYHQLLTFPMMYAYTENFILPLSHDEVVHGKKSLLDKMPGDYGQKFAGLRGLYTYFITSPGKKLLFMGGEMAQFIEWREDRELDWFLMDYEMHRKYHFFVQQLNALYLQEKALWEIDQDWSGFEWIDVHNHEQGIIVFCRKGKSPEDRLVVLINFQPYGYGRHRIGVEKALGYREILNTDSADFGGGDRTNPGLLKVERVPWHGREFSLEIQVPPLGAMILKPELA
ncbi:1,4-alpha-glucan branching protein GlgB [Desulfitobacterium sp. PCE1]|uniref:1,4-alpha-glucan branching protein GlgB n=1 Tax=Desulfitobacterium sp. PCE1 TaxID=146907 RepID=UPI00037EB3B1|nr:1,4-alpha-glucan branching protein GlgB [Desulfitobacterium sp. PCE1]